MLRAGLFLSSLVVVFVSGCSGTGGGLASKIMFESGRDGQVAIFVMDGNGANVLRLTDPAFESSSPSLSRDGTKVVFQTSRDGNSEIYIMNADGTGQVRLTDDPAIDLLPSFSYDGSMVTFVSNRTGSNEIFVMDSDGSNVQRVTMGGFTNLSPKVNPAGDRIAYTSQRGLSPEVFMIDVDGSNEEQVSQDEDTWNLSPCFMHDGLSLLMVEYTPLSGQHRIIRLNLGSSVETPLFTAQDLGTISLSPDGSHLAYSALVGGASDVFRSTLNGLGRINLTNNAAHDTAPSFGP